MTRSRFMAHRVIAYLPDDRPVFEDDLPRLSWRRALAELVAFSAIAVTLLLIAAVLQIVAA